MLKFTFESRHVQSVDEGTVRKTETTSSISSRGKSTQGIGYTGGGRAEKPNRGL